MNDELKSIEFISLVAYEFAYGYERYKNRKHHRREHILKELKRTGAKSVTFTVADDQDLIDLMTTFKRYDTHL